MTQACNSGDDKLIGKSEKAYFGAGCFWGVEVAFRSVRGVLSTAVGYQGGHTLYPTYDDVCSGETNHVEVVAVTFDPDQVSYEQLLEIFWQNHDPTTPDKQGPDVGSQYRSAIFCVNDSQKQQAHQSKQLLEQSKRFRKTIVTEITFAGDFYLAEEYHQQYLEKRGLASCSL